MAQFLIAIYGGYFGGGIGFLMMAALTVAGLPVRPASATENVLAATMTRPRWRFSCSLATSTGRTRRRSAAAVPRRADRCGT